MTEVSVQVRGVYLLSTVPTKTLKVDIPVTGLVVLWLTKFLNLVLSDTTW